MKDCYRRNRRGKEMKDCFSHLIQGVMQGKRKTASSSTFKEMMMKREDAEGKGFIPKERETKR